MSANIWYNEANLNALHLNYELDRFCMSFCFIIVIACKDSMYCLLEKAWPIETILAHKVGLSKRVCPHETAPFGVMVATFPKEGMRSTRQAPSQELVTPVLPER